VSFDALDLKAKALGGCERRRCHHRNLTRLKHLARCHVPWHVAKKRGMDMIEINRLVAAILTTAVKEKDKRNVKEVLRTYDEILKELIPDTTVDVAEVSTDELREAIREFVEKG
jgi:hypothetical protein